MFGRVHKEYFIKNPKQVNYFWSKIGWGTKMGHLGRIKTVVLYNLRKCFWVEKFYLFYF